jgi:hypothetical protein
MPSLFFIIEKSGLHLGFVEEEQKKRPTVQTASQSTCRFPLPLWPSVPRSGNEAVIASAQREAIQATSKKSWIASEQKALLAMTGFVVLLRKIIGILI